MFDVITNFVTFLSSLFYDSSPYYHEFDKIQERNWPDKVSEEEEKSYKISPDTEKLLELEAGEVKKDLSLVIETSIKNIRLPLLLAENDKEISTTLGSLNEDPNEVLEHFEKLFDGHLKFSKETIEDNCQDTLNSKNEIYNNYLNRSATAYDKLKLQHEELKARMSASENKNSKLIYESNTNSLRLTDCLNNIKLAESNIKLADNNKECIKNNLVCQEIIKTSNSLNSQLASGQTLCYKNFQTQVTLQNSMHEKSIQMTSDAERLRGERNLLESELKSLRNDKSECQTFDSFSKDLSEGFKEIHIKVENTIGTTKSLQECYLGLAESQLNVPRHFLALFYQIFNRGFVTFWDYPTNPVWKYAELKLGIKLPSFIKKPVGSIWFFFMIVTVISLFVTFYKAFFVHFMPAIFKIADNYEPEQKKQNKTKQKSFLKFRGGFSANLMMNEMFLDSNVFFAIHNEKVLNFLKKSTLKEISQETNKIIETINPSYANSKSGLIISSYPISSFKKVFICCTIWSQLVTGISPTRVPNWVYCSESLTFNMVYVQQKEVFKSHEFKPKTVVNFVESPIVQKKVLSIIVPPMKGLKKTNKPYLLKRHEKRLADKKKKKSNQVNYISKYTNKKISSSTAKDAFEGQVQVDPIKCK